MKRFVSRAGVLRLLLAAAVIGLCVFLNLPHAPLAAHGSVDTPEVGGELRFRTGDGETPIYSCPLERTDVDSQISGMFARVRVRQVFQNPTSHKIEALYVFPLPDNAAVDQMVMTVGKHRIIGVVKEREAARAVYEAAKAQGKIASLLDQERPNIFTQSVANIEPGAKVVIEISMVQTVTFDNGVFTWSFPTVVGPRYFPGSNIGGGSTDRVPDAGKISPPVVPPAMRAGHSLGLVVHIDTGGLPLTDMESAQHPILVDSQHVSEGKAAVTLASRDEIPNRDFVLHYRIGDNKIGDTMFTYKPLTGPKAQSGDGDRYFSLLVTPPIRVRPTEVLPKEMQFVIDCSGSMEGFPIEKAKETMKRAILTMNPNDTFNLISFSGGTGKCFPSAVPNTKENRDKAIAYLGTLNGSGGTEMLPAVHEALDGAPKDGRMRMVCFMTDGFIGNEGEIIDEIQKNVKVARIFAFGVGTSVNHFLLDGMVRAGRGAAEYVPLNGETGPVIERFRKRIQSPVLTDISLDFHGLPVYDVYPRQIPDLFDASPVVVFGRIRGNTLSSQMTVTLHGKTAAGAFSRSMHGNVPADTSVVTPTTGDDVNIGNDALVPLWARAKVDDLVTRDPVAWNGENNYDPAVKKAVTDIGVRYNLMTPFTSFVAVEDRSYTGTDAPDMVSVPVETPKGVSYDGAVINRAPVFATQRLYGVSGSMAANYAAPTNSGFSAQPGDPLIRITDAPADTRLIAAVLPDGTTIPLVKNAKTLAWEAHFDIPLAAAEGAYDVKIYMIRASGERQTLTLHYRVDKSGAVAAGRIRRVGDGAIYRLEIEIDKEAARVTALLPDGERVEMRRASELGTRYTADVSGTALSSGNASSVVTFIITDRAHNRTTITVDGSR